MKKIFAILAVGAALSNPLAGATITVVDGILQIVHDAVITYQQRENLILPDVDLLTRQFANNRPMFDQKLHELRVQAEEALVENQLILHDFRDTFKLPESIFDQDVKDFIHERHNDRVQLIKKLENDGLTYEDFRKDFRDSLIINEMVRKFVPDPIISPVKIENYYLAHRDAFLKAEDEVNLRVIVLNKPVVGKDSDAGQTRRRAEEILALLKGGATFPEMARIYSQGSLQMQGGLTGWESLTVVREELRSEVAKLKPGEFTGVLETPDSYSIIKLEDRRPPHIRPLSEVRDEIERTLKTEERKRLRQKWIARLKAKTYIGTSFY